MLFDMGIKENADNDDVFNLKAFKQYSSHIKPEVCEIRCQQQLGISAKLPLNPAKTQFGNPVH